MHAVTMCVEFCSFLVAERCNLSLLDAWQGEKRSARYRGAAHREGIPRVCPRSKECPDLMTAVVPCAAD